jgi:hypothetical protein
MVARRRIPPRALLPNRTGRLGSHSLPFALALSLLVSHAEAAELRLTWVDNSGGTAYTRIERKTGVGGTYAALTTQAPGVSSYVDTAAVAGVTYCYRVQAYNAAGASAYSNEECKTVADTVLPAAGTATVSGTPGGTTCAGDCTEPDPTGTVVTPPPAGSVPGGSGGSADCQDGEATVTASTSCNARGNGFAVPGAAPPPELAPAGRTAPSPSAEPQDVCFTSGQISGLNTLTITTVSGSTFSGVWRNSAAGLVGRFSGTPDSAAGTGTLGASLYMAVGGPGDAVAAFLAATCSRTTGQCSGQLYPLLETASTIQPLVLQLASCAGVTTR